MYKIIPYRQANRAFSLLKSKYGLFPTLIVPSFWVFGSFSVFFYAFVQRIPKEYRPLFDMEALSGLAFLLLLLPPFAIFVSRGAFMLSVVAVGDLAWRSRQISNKTIRNQIRSFLIFFRRFLRRFEHLLQLFFFFVVFSKFFLDGFLILAFLLSALIILFVIISTNYYYEFSRHAVATVLDAVEDPFFPKGVPYDKKLFFLLRSVALVLPAIAVILGLFLGWDRIKREVCILTNYGTVSGSVYARTANGTIVVKLSEDMGVWVRTFPTENAQFIPFSSIRSIQNKQSCL